MAFKQLENISNYLTTCESWLESTDSTFRSTDLYEGKDMNSVLGNLNALRSFVNRHCASLPTFLATRQKTSAPSFGTSTPRAPRSSSAPSTAASNTPSLSPQSSNPSISVEATKIDVTKLEDDVRIKAEFKFNVEHADNVLKWIEDVLGISIQDRDFHNALKSGEILCDLVNRISPKAVPVTHRTSLAFKQMENISNYLRACREVLKMKD